ncbi:MAG: cbb3-type cytochrome c oxidase subunit I [Planctomycetes bacterium]|nr:cbb3-type cytochrome c oxidase subunit I [Planctomycetota bacterium]
MSTEGHAGSAHAEPSFFRKYIWSTNHKTIGKQFLFTSFIFLGVAGFLILLVRWNLAHPGEPVPLIGKLLFGGSGAVPPEKFIFLTSMHGTLMIFFVIIPILVGAFGNFLIPLHVGTHDMAFPTLNALSYWLFWGACILIVIGIVMGFASPQDQDMAGWTLYPPLSAYAGPVMTWVLLAMIFVGFSSILGAVNYLTTIAKMRAPGLSWFRLPLTTWAQFITAVLQLLATPVLAAALTMLTFERVLGMNFFTPGGLELSGQPVGHSGGVPLLWQHIFWFYSHPAVYILVLPAMGMASDLLSVGARKAIFGYKAMVLSICAIAGLGFVVWAHHMFVSGMNPYLGMGFMISTMLIALPSSIKVFNWLGTLWRGQIRFDTPTLNAISFVAMFVIGGLSGIYMAATPVDIHLHDTYYIVAHFHYVVFGGSLFAVFGAVFFWFPKMFGRMMNETLGKIHWFLSFFFFNSAFFIMHVVGLAGHPRRYASIAFLEQTLGHMQWMNRMITYSAICLGLAQLVLIFNFFWSVFKGKKAEPNPWQANTLEWTVPSPAPEHNYHVVPTVHHGPYEYGAGNGKDWMSQVESAGAAPSSERH